MMKSQPESQLLEVAPGRALRLGHRGGELNVLAGRAWLTRDHDLGDYLVGPGERLRLKADDNAVVESWQPGEALRLRWQPRPRRHPRFAGRLRVELLRALDFLAALAAAGLAAFARGSAASEGRCRR
jgi:Protein of unknown function (DUF2917)